MSIGLRFNNATQRGDLFQDENGSLGFDQGLETAVLISLFTWRRAGPEDNVHPMHRRGWWGNTFPDVAGDEWGSKLWLVFREKTNEEGAQKGKKWAEEALAWLLEDGVASAVPVEVSVEGNAPNRRLCVTVAIQRPDEPAPRWRRVWEVHENAV